MAKFSIGKGMDDYITQLENLDKNSDEILKRCVYVGAAIVADTVKAALHTIPIDENKYGYQRYGTSKRPIKGISTQQRNDLIASMGLAPIQQFAADINTKIGWDGYGSTKTAKYPNGVPNQMLMRAVESGTSFMQKTPVVRKAVSSAKKRAEEEIKNMLEKEIAERMR